VEVPCAASPTARLISPVAAFCCSTAAAIDPLIWLSDAGDFPGGGSRSRLDRGYLSGNLSGRLGGLAGQILDLLGDHGEAFAGFSGPRRLNRRVERQQVGLRRYLADQSDDVADLPGGVHEARNHVDGPARPLDRSLAGPCGFLGALADLADRGGQFLDRRGDGLDIGADLIGGAGGIAAERRVIVRPAGHATGGEPHFPGGDAGGIQFARHLGLETEGHLVESGLAIEFRLLLEAHLFRFEPRPLDRMLAEGFDRVRHASDFVPPVKARHRRRQIATGQTGHEPGHIAHGARDAVSDQPGDHERQQDSTGCHQQAELDHAVGVAVEHRDRQSDLDRPDLRCRAETNRQQNAVAGLSGQTDGAQLREALAPAIGGEAAGVEIATHRLADRRFVRIGNPGPASGDQPGVAGFQRPERADTALDHVEGKIDAGDADEPAVTHQRDDNDRQQHRTAADFPGHRVGYHFAPGALGRGVEGHLFGGLGAGDGQLAHFLAGPAIPVGDEPAFGRIARGRIARDPGEIGVASVEAVGFERRPDTQPGGVLPKKLFQGAVEALTRAGRAGLLERGRQVAQRPPRHESRVHVVADLLRLGAGDLFGKGDGVPAQRSRRVIG
jgi:hypothetical protein